MKKVYLGSFNAEAYYAEEGYCRLPVFSLGGQKNNLFDAMDELMLPMLEKDDALITKYAVDKTFADYYGSEMQHFTAYSCMQAPNEGEPEGSIFHIIDQMRDENIVRELTEEKNQIVEYSLIPDCYELYRHLNIGGLNKPSMEIVKRVNNKAYSNQLRNMLDLPCKGTVAGSAEEFADICSKMLEQYKAILVKDIYGVSGQGIIVVQNDYMIKRMTKHFASQKYERFAFLLEPYLDKDRDFSCQFSIGEDGEIRIQGYQENNNRKFTYLGSEFLSEEELMRLDPGYNDAIRRIGGRMYEDGYHGPVCVDSMILKDQTVIPLVEINARLSMGRFNLMTCNTLKKYGTRSNLLFFKTSRKEKIGFEQLLDRLEQAGILYRKGAPCGVIPMAPNTWRFTPLGEPTRMYFQIVSEYGNDSVIELQREKLIQSLEALKIQIFE
ncbi:MAG: hypothetical protein J6Z35_01190 [Lachnospiraceae bacterium]|nr:hypothetical protein [Lachnospiraceae bacterium]